MEVIKIISIVACSILTTMGMEDDKHKSNSSNRHRPPVCRYNSQGCTNPTCKFNHPMVPICRYGNKCTSRNCKFRHTKPVLVSKCHDGNVYTKSDETNKSKKSKKNNKLRHANKSGHIISSTEQIELYGQEQDNIPHSKVTKPK